MHFLVKSTAALVVGLLPSVSLADFTGAYAGVAIGSVSGSGESQFEFESDAREFDLNDSIAFSGFAGYQFQSGDIVYGGEIAISTAPDAEIEGAPGSELDGVSTDIKGRIGYVFDENVMAYGTAGFTTFSVDDGENEQGDLDGFIVGAGIDYKVSDSIIVGGEFTTRQAEGETENAEVEIDANSLALRAAFKF